MEAAVVAEVAVVVEAGVAVAMEVVAEVAVVAEAGVAAAVVVEAELPLMKKITYTKI